MKTLSSPKYTQGDECVLKSQVRLKSRKLFISHSGKQKHKMKPVVTTGKKYSWFFFSECEDLEKHLHGVTGYQFSKLIPVPTPIHHFGSSAQSWALCLAKQQSSGSCTITTIGLYLVQLKQLTKKEVTLLIDLNTEHGADLCQHRGKPPLLGNLSLKTN